MNQPAGTTFAEAGLLPAGTRNLCTADLDYYRLEVRTPSNSHGFPTSRRS